MKEKQTFKTLLALLAITLVLLPFVLTLNHFFSAAMERTRLYQLIQNHLLPWLIRISGVVLRFLGLGVEAGKDTLYLTWGEKKAAVYFGWNCLGWQSLLLLLASLLVGFQGNFTFASKLIAGGISFLGIFLVNILRVTIIALLIFRFNQLSALVFHDYLAAFLTLGWLFFFWWFCYAFVLEPNGKKQTTESMTPKRLVDQF